VVIVIVLRKMGKYDSLLEEYKNTTIDEDVQFRKALNALNEIADDAANTAELYANAEAVLNDIDERFREETKLDRVDVAFLMLATALQISRWIVIAKVNQALEQKIADARVDHNDGAILSMEKEKRQIFYDRHQNDPHIKSKHRDWANIIFDSVPYDITKGSPLFGVNMEAGFHRVHTLGHDPVLGWIFGTMNILSDTITLEDFRTFNVCMDKGRKAWSGRTTLPIAFYDAYDSIREDSTRLPAAVFAQAIHLKSDVYTKQGLPVPILESFAPDFAGEIYKEGYDSLCLMKDVAVVGVQAVSSILINMLVAAIHGLFYDSKQYPDRELYEVKTRKIISISNVIASSSNLIWVGGNAWMGNEAAWKDLDIGGILVTAYRLVKDVNFIRRVKQEYLENEWNKKVLGNEYSFITEADVSKRDIQRGIEIQANADAEKQEKMAKGLEKQGELLAEIKEGQHEVRNAVGVVLDEMAAEEAQDLFDFEIVKGPRDLGRNEKLALCAAIYTLMDKFGQNNDFQTIFYLNLEKYLGVNRRITGFNFDNLNNIDSHSDRIIMLKVICAFLSLGDENFSFKEDANNYGWLQSFTSENDVKAACDEIREEIEILGNVGIVNRYKTVEPKQSSTIQNQEKPKIEEAEIVEINKENNDYSDLKSIIQSYVIDEDAFGKQLKKIPRSVTKELKKTFQNLNLDTVLFASDVGNGCLVFTTAALYIRTGNLLRGKYLRIPYNLVNYEKMATGAGKAKGTRKLILPYSDENGTESIAIVDDSKITEERLQDLLQDIHESKCDIAKTDNNLQLQELNAIQQITFFQILGNIMLREDRCMTELYLLIRDHGLEDRWEEIAKEFDDDDGLEERIERFQTTIPYPSENSILSQSVSLALRTIFRTNTLEGKEVSILSADSEDLIKKLGITCMSEKEFNEVIRMAALSKRNVTSQDLFDIDTQLKNDALYHGSIERGYSVLSEIVQEAVDKENAKKNKKTLGIIKKNR